MPVQEPGTKRARPLPYQPNANLGGIASGQASLSFSNAGAHVSRASHFSVYDNRAAGGDLTAYPAATPGQYTVAAGGSVSASAPVSGRYDLTVVGPNRFLRHFTGDTTRAGATAQVTASYQPSSGQHGPGRDPVLALELANEGGSAVTFTVTSNHYGRHGGRTYRVPGHGHATYLADPLATSDGWYDVTVTVSGDSTWSRRYVGHLENGQPSITG
jgi:phospholipase C